VPAATPLFAGAILCWLAAAFIHLYYFAYPSVDTWCYAAPATMARAPLELTMPFLGTFEGADKGWGLHWPGGPLLTSLVAPFLPHNPAAHVSIYLFYWLLLGLATAALVRRLTESPWLALCGFLFVAGDRASFGVTWMERYELLDTAVAIAGVLALCEPEDWHPRLRLAVIGAAFFLFPLLQPITCGLGLAWLVCIGLRSWALKRGWTQFWIAAAATAAGWAAFLGYYLSRPWLLVIFRLHARMNVIAARAAAPPGVGMFVRRLMHIGDPTKTATIVYVAALGGAIYLLVSFWKARARWREFVSREELILFTAVALVCTLVLAQFNYTAAYWVPSWPFSVAMVCQVIWRLLQSAPNYRRIWWGALVAVLVLHCSFLPARTYLWYKLGFVDLRARLRDFAATLPQGGRIFIPEVLFETYATNGREGVYMNTIPTILGDAEQKKYLAYIQPLMRSGDVLVTDAFQWTPPRMDPHGPGWREIGHCNLNYQGQAAHGFELTAFQKQ
jgi:hypothetical protein